MRTERLIAAAAFVVVAFVAVPAAEAIAQSTAVETQGSIKNCRYYYHGRHWRYRWLSSSGYHTSGMIAQVRLRCASNSAPKRSRSAASSTWMRHA
jgi:hypothetical protein